MKKDKQDDFDLGYIDALISKASNDAIHKMGYIYQDKRMRSLHTARVFNTIACLRFIEVCEGDLYEDVFNKPWQGLQDGYFICKSFNCKPLIDSFNNKGDKTYEKGTHNEFKTNPNIFDKDTVNNVPEPFDFETFK
jgi:hypothetical protein